MALWMLYATAVAVLVAVGTRTLEAHFTRAGRARWLWMAGLGAAAALPIVRPALAPILESWWTASHPDAASVVVGSPSVIATFVPDPSRLAVYTAFLATAWLGATLALAGVTLAGVWRLRRAARHWTAAELEGVSVLLSRDVGPAVVGLVRPSIVLPEWVLGLDRERRRLIVAHELEHLRGRDPWLLALGMACAVLMPWNAGVWWSFLRLRHAVETDCDQRVVRTSETTVTSYARLLLEVGTRTTRPVPLGAGFGERTSSLERRIRTMVRGSEVGRAGLAMRVAAAAGLVLAACSVESPEGTVPTAVDDPPAEAPASSAPAVEAVSPDLPADDPMPVTEAVPGATPFTTAPVILNRREVREALGQEYPPLLRNAGVGGTVEVWLHVDSGGTVTDLRIDQSSGHQALDDAALRVSRTLRFSPAENDGEAVSAWISVPISFRVEVPGGAAGNLPT